MKVLLVYEDALSFKKCIDAISVLIDEAEFLVDKEKLSLKATDPSQISMVSFSLKKNSFKKFEVEKEEKLGLDLDYFSQIMSRAKAGDSLEISLDEKASTLKAVFKGSSKRSFSIPLIDVSSQELPTPKIDFEADIKISASVLQDALKDAVLVSSHVSLGVDSERFFIQASSSKGSLLNETTKKDKALIEFKVKKEGKAVFPLEYLSDMVKAADSNTVVSLELKANHPIQLSYSIGEAFVSYFLAPRIES